MHRGSLARTRTEGFTIYNSIRYNFNLGVNRSNGRKQKLKIGRENWIGRGRGKELKVGKRREEKVGKEEEKEKEYIVQIQTFKNLFLIL